MMRVKYPRTPHLPWSPGATEDDIHQGNLSCFANKQVVVTEKMDGENTTFTVTLYTLVRLIVVFTHQEHG
ncbi:RNA ligase family protein [Pseudoalteromonas sp. B160]|uniref:RNA ligase family protein n=1 Tax=Pseudoalteromonas sp. B160 TaxID=630414 RepID=UPI00301D1801